MQDLARIGILVAELDGGYSPHHGRRFFPQKSNLLIVFDRQGNVTIDTCRFRRTDAVRGLSGRALTG